MQKTLALILAGGRVDELGVLTKSRPKSIMPFGGLYRIIDFPLSNLMNSGIDTVGVLSQYRSDSLIKHLENPAVWDMMGSGRWIRILPPMQGNRRSDWYKGTADAVYQNMDFVQQENPDYVLVISGDHVYHMDYNQLLEYHQRCKAEITMGFVQSALSDMHRFGQAVMDDSEPEGGQVVQYVEKPQQKISDWVSMTIYLFNYKTLVAVMDSIANKPEIEHLGRDVFPDLVKQAKVFGYKHQGIWEYTRTLDEYYQANIKCLQNDHAIDFERWGIYTNLQNNLVCERSPSIIGPKADISGSMIHSGCIIEGKAENSILYPGVRIGRDSTVSNSICFHDTVIESNCWVDKIITDESVVIGSNTVIGDRYASSDGSAELTVIGQAASIPAGLNIGRGVTIYPHVDGTKLSRNVSDGEVVR
jgi:glucose-1-phosphate adenylyltransferase